MKKILLFIGMLFLAVNIWAHPINNYKYVMIEHQEDAKKDIEDRLKKEFPILGFVLITDQEYNKFNDTDKDLVLTAKYRCRQSGECIFQIKLINQNGEEIYEDEQIGGAGFMSRKNDRQSAIKKIFKELKKKNYKFEGPTK